MRQITIQQLGWLAFITLSLTITSCNANSVSTTPMTVLPTDSVVFFPRQKLVDGEWIRLSGEIYGEIIEEDGCLRLNSNEGRESYLIIWPPDYSLNTENDTIQIYNAAGQIMGTIGERVHMGGGEINSLEGVISVDQQLLEELPPNCTGPYWISAGIISDGTNGNSD